MALEHGTSKSIIDLTPGNLRRIYIQAGGNQWHLGTKNLSMK